MILSQDALLSLNNIFEKEIDVIFMDPPYRQELEKQALQILKSMKYVTPDTLIIVEASKETDFAYLDEMGYDLLKEKIYKTNKHLFIRKKA